MKRKLLSAAVLAGILALLLIGAQRSIRMVHRVENPPLPVIVIDPGHGSSDGGTTGINGAVEKEINLSIAKKLRLILQVLGYDVVLTREDDNSIADSKLADMRLRLSIANTYPDGLFLSIHQNAYPDSTERGAQVFYNETIGGSKELATLITDNFKQYLDPDNRRKIKPGGDQYMLLKQTVVPSVLVECGFLSNREEADLLVSEEYQLKLALCIAVSILQYS